jgi:hypothetical protein
LAPIRGDEELAVKAFSPTAILTGLSILIFSGLASADLRYGGYGGMKIGGSYRVGGYGGISLDADDDDDGGPTEAQCRSALDQSALPQSGSIIVQWLAGNASPNLLSSDQTYRFSFGPCSARSEPNCHGVKHSNIHGGDELASEKTKPWISVPMLWIGCQLARMGAKSDLADMEVYEYHTIWSNKLKAVSFVDIPSAIRAPVQIDADEAGEFRVYYRK